MFLITTSLHNVSLKKVDIGKTNKKNRVRFILIVMGLRADSAKTHSCQDIKKKIAHGSAIGDPAAAAEGV